MVEWTVYGKISKITKIKGGVTTVIDYLYDETGNRINQVINKGGVITKTWYVRDATGNAMAIYQKEGSADLKQAEVYLYGSSRLGVWKPVRNVEEANWELFDKASMAGTNGRLTETWNRGNQQYELSNHLGNVLVAVSDKLLPVEDPLPSGAGTVDYNMPDLVSASDYYPFGMLMPGRQSGVMGRYGFNGKENDNEVKGEGNQQDYGMRIYDPRLGRFLSVDPLTRKYPELTPYQFASNRPIDGVDLDGLEYMKGRPSIYGLNKFQIATKYVEGAIEIRNRDIHQIVVNHPWNYAASGDDDSVPEVTMVKKRSSSNRAQRRQASETKDATRNMSADILGGILATLDFGYNVYYNNKYKEELQYASESVHALNDADILVKAAYNSTGFPELLKNSQGNKALTDLTNYITDGTIPSDNITYGILIKTWGDLIYDNREKVLKNAFDFSPETTVYKTKTTTTNGGEVRLEVKYFETTGNNDPAVINANKLLKNTTVPPATNVKPAN